MAANIAEEDQSTGTQGQRGSHRKPCYTGETWSSLKHGKGIFQTRSGDVYEGYFFCDHQHGPGQTCHPDGSSHTGYYFAGEKHGYGVESYPNGDQYEGLFRHDTYYGPGILSHSDGSVDVGLWMGKRLIRTFQDLRETYEIPYLNEVLLALPRRTARALHVAHAAPQQLSSVDKYQPTKRPRSIKSNESNEKTNLESVLDVEYRKAVGGDVQTESSEQRPRRNEKATNSSPVFLSIFEFSKNMEAICPTFANFMTEKFVGFGGRNGPQDLLTASFFDACVRGHLEEVEKLVLDGVVDINVVDISGMSAIFASTFWSRKCVMRFLLNCGADVNQVADCGYSVLELCFVMYYCFIEKFNRWKDNDPSVTLVLFPPPKTLAVENQITAQKRPVTPQKSSTSLSYASTNKKKTNTQLSEANKEKNLPEPELDLTVDQSGSLKSYKVIKKVKIEPRIMDYMRAANELAAVPNIIGDSELRERPAEDKAMFLCWLKNWQRMMKESLMILFEYGSDWQRITFPVPPIFAAVRGLDADLVQQLLTMKVAVDQRITWEGKSLTPLLMACGMMGRKTAEVVSVLLHAGADANAPEYEDGKPDKSKEASARKPIHVVCNRDPNDSINESLLELLLKFKAKCDVAWNHFSPLVFAIKQGNESLVRTLLAGGANINTDLGDNKGNALCVLAGLGVPEAYVQADKDISVFKRLLKLLMEHNGDFTVKVPTPDGASGSPLDFAVQLYSRVTLPTSLDPKLRSDLVEFRNEVLAAYREGVKVSVLRHRKIGIAGVLYPKLLPLLKKDPQLIDASDPLIESSLSPEEAKMYQQLEKLRGHIRKLLEADVLDGDKLVRPTAKVPMRKDRAHILGGRTLGGPGRTLEENKAGMKATSAMNLNVGKNPNRVNGSTMNLTFSEDDVFMENHSVTLLDEEGDEDFEHEDDDPDHATLLVPAVHVIDHEGDELPLGAEVTEYKYCSQCGISAGATFIACPKCTSVFYCSKEHQSQHWPAHRPKCSEIRKRKAHADQHRKEAHHKKTQRRRSPHRDAKHTDGYKTRKGAYNSPGGTEHEENEEDESDAVYYEEDGKNVPKGTKAAKKGAKFKDGVTGKTGAGKGGADSESSLVEPKGRIKNKGGNSYENIVNATQNGRRVHKGENDRAKRPPWTSTVQKVNRLHMDAEIKAILTEHYQELVKRGVNLAESPDLVELKLADFYAAVSSCRKVDVGQTTNCKVAKKSWQTRGLLPETLVCDVKSSGSLLGTTKPKKTVRYYRMKRPTKLI